MIRIKRGMSLNIRNRPTPNQYWSELSASRQATSVKQIENRRLHSHC
jgi:hypothetical protein